MPDGFGDIANLIGSLVFAVRNRIPPDSADLVVKQVVDTFGGEAMVSFSGRRFGALRHALVMEEWRSGEVSARK